MTNRPEPEDHYAILGVARTASLDEIRAAFRARAKALHPDKNRQLNTKEAFQKIQAAYTVLKHPEQRRRYDLSGPAVVIDPPVPTPRAEPAPARPWWRQLRFAVVALPAVALPVAIYWTIGWATNEAPSAAAKAADLEKEMEAAIVRNAPSFYAPPPEPATFEMIGKDGRKLVVPGADYKRLGPIYARLVAEGRQLHRQKEELDGRKAALEKEQRELTASRFAAAGEFRIKVDAFNREGAEFRRRFELHAAEVEDYFKQVERVAVNDR